MDATRASANMVYGKILRYTTGALRNGPRGEGGEITNQSSSPIAGDPVLSVMYFAYGSTLHVQTLSLNFGNYKSVCSLLWASPNPEICPDLLESTRVIPVIQ